MSVNRILVFVGLIFFIPCLAQKETLEDRKLRKQMYENKEALTAENKDMATKLITDHIEKCKKKLENKQSFSEKIGVRSGCLAGLGGIICGIGFRKSHKAEDKNFSEVHRNVEGLIRSENRCDTWALSNSFTVASVSASEVLKKLSEEKLKEYNASVGSRYKIYLGCLLISVAGFYLAYHLETERRSDVQKLTNKLELDNKLLVKLNSMVE